MGNLHAWNVFGQDMSVPWQAQDEVETIATFDTERMDIANT
jgi:hypothetical protein